MASCNLESTKALVASHVVVEDLIVATFSKCWRITSAFNCCWSEIEIKLEQLISAWIFFPASTFACIFLMSSSQKGMLVSKSSSSDFSFVAWMSREKASALGDSPWLISFYRRRSCLLALTVISHFFWKSYARVSNRGPNPSKKWSSSLLLVVSGELVRDSTKPLISK